MIEKIGRFFIWAFLADAILSTLHELTGRGEGLGFLREIVAFTVVLWGIVLYFVMVFSPRPAKRVLLLPVLFAVWTGVFSAMPLSVLYPQEIVMGLAFVQLALAIGIFVAFGRTTETGWNVPVVNPQRPAFTWGNFAIGAAISAVFAVLMGSGAVVSVAKMVEARTDGYVRVRPNGVFFEERRFKKGDQEVCLVGMVHVAKGSFYDDLAASLKRSAPVLVLLEGVSDEKGILSGKLDYSRIAQLLGISSQSESSFTEEAAKGLEEAENAKKDAKPQPVQYQRADVDISSFHPKTVAAIGEIGDVLSSKTFEEALQKLNKPNSVLADEAAVDAVWNDILESRNTHLLAEMQEALKTHKTVVVPWGAAHMPGIQKEIEAWGFVETDRSMRRAF
jgi:hypothetical protein